jgi:hypothetical protein
MDSESVKIELIKINVSGKVIELTTKEARLLFGELNNLFGPQPSAPVYIPCKPFGDSGGGTYPWWDQPIYCNPNAEPFPDKWQVTYNAYTGPALSISI